MSGTRTDEFPMAFSAWEFTRGALIAYGLFLAFTAVGWIMFGPLASLMALFYAAPVGLATLILIGAPLALLAGLLLRRVPAVPVHLAWFGAVGLVAGTAGVLLFLSVYDAHSMWTWPHVPDLSIVAPVLWMPIFQALLTVPSVMLGWRITSKKALRG
jgi:hypothetical protein